MQIKIIYKNKSTHTETVAGVTDISSSNTTITFRLADGEYVSRWYEYVERIEISEEERH